MNILVFGDSIGCGYWDPGGGWVQKLRTFYDQEVISKKDYTADYHEIYNMSVDGNTTADVIKRFEADAMPRCSSKGTIIIFSIGTNDCLYLNKEKNLRVSEKIFEKNIEKLIAMASKISSKIIFTGLTPVDETRMKPMKWAPQFSAKNVYIEKYDNIIKSVCDRKNILFVEVYSKFRKKEYEKLLEDGNHPNSKGHEIVFRIVKDYLIKEKIIR